MIATASSTQTIAQTATNNHPSGIGLMHQEMLVTPRSFPAGMADHKRCERNE